MPSQYRFSIGSLMFITVIVAIAAGVGSALYRQEVNRVAVVLWAISLPFALLIGIAGFFEIRKWLRKRKRK